jgi:hypothetical protein
MLYADGLTRRDAGEVLHGNIGQDHDFSLSNKTPAEVAGIRSPYETWTDFVRADK